MKIERHLVPETTLQQFAADNDLLMQVFERDSETVKLPHIGNNARFYAHFKNAEVKEGSFLRGEFGDGADEETAIAEYAKAISETLLIIDAGTDQRREIRVPRLV